ncbi:hypothetical protein [Pararhodobacter sp.]|nr:hypothetical protein [Pararhodobacter sp.]
MIRESGAPLPRAVIARLVLARLTGGDSDTRTNTDQIERGIAYRSYL